MNEYCLLEDDLFRLWEIFISLDEGRRNRLTLGQLFDQIDERDFSVIAPYLERFYELIEIKLPDITEADRMADGMPDNLNNDRRNTFIKLRMSKTLIAKGQVRHMSKYHHGCSFPEFIPILVGFCLFTREQIYNCKRLFYYCLFGFIVCFNMLD
jgi:hypothetical protein